MISKFGLVGLAVASAACAGSELAAIRESDLDAAYQMLQTNLAAIHQRDAEAYLAHYLNSPELVIVAADSLRRGFLLFSEARRVSDEWPDTIITDEPTLVWLGPGVVWAGFRFVAVLGGDTTRGVSERVFVKTVDGWKIKITGSMEQ